MDAIAISAIIGAATGLINSVVNAMVLMKAQGNGVVARETRGIVERVEVNSNGHLTALTAMAATVDPAIAAEAAAKVLKTAQDVAKPPPS